MESKNSVDEELLNKNYRMFLEEIGEGFVGCKRWALAMAYNVCVGETFTDDDLDFMLEIYGEEGFVGEMVLGLADEMLSVAFGE